MSGKRPFFLSGGNARILLNNKTVAYATNVSFRISVKHAAPRVLGRFEVEVIQPLAYDVTGTLSVYRYGRGMQSFMGQSSPPGTHQLGDGIGSWGGGIAASLGLPNPNGTVDGGANEAFNPSRMFQSKMFNIEIRQTVPGVVGHGRLVKGSRDGNDNYGNIVQSQRFADVLNKLSNGTKKDDETPVIVLRDCRFEDMAFELSKKGVAMMSFTFRARYVDDDTMIARKSGVGQELS